MKKTISLTSLLILGLITGITRADYVFGTPNKLGSAVNNGSETSISTDGLELFFEGRQSDGHGPADIYVSTRASISDPWGEAVILGAPISGPDWNTSPDISSDGLELYFTSTRSGPWDIWVSTRASRDDPWEEPVNLGPTVNSSAQDYAPSISGDGLSLYFSSDRSGGFGKLDLWVTTRATKDAPWEEPVNLGPTVNSSLDEAMPDISADGRVLFFGDFMGPPQRDGGYGGQDLWMTTRGSTSDPWQEPVNLGPVVNSSAFDFSPNISSDGSTFYFTSDRGGVNRFEVVDIWQAQLIPIVDFNKDEVIDVQDIIIMTEHWGEDYTLCDIGPTPLGDGIVDVQDLVVLTTYIEPIDRTLIAHWALDETEGIIAHDSVNGFDDYVMGGALWRPASGVIDGALELDGVDDCLIAAFGPNPADGPFSILAWIKGGAPGQVIFSQSLGSNWLMMDAEGKLTTELEGFGSGLAALLSDTIITDGQWHNISLVWDGSQRMLCVDGVVVAEDTLDGLKASPGGLYMGVGKYYAAGTFFFGLIDDVRIYNRAVKP